MEETLQHQKQCNINLKATFSFIFFLLHCSSTLGVTMWRQNEDAETGRENATLYAWETVRYNSTFSVYATRRVIVGVWLTTAAGITNFLDMKHKTHQTKSFHNAIIYPKDWVFRMLHKVWFTVARLQRAGCKTVTRNSKFIGSEPVV